MSEHRVVIPSEVEGSRGFKQRLLHAILQLTFASLPAQANSISARMEKLFDGRRRKRARAKIIAKKKEPVALRR